MYQASLEFISWTTDVLSNINCRTAVKDQLDRASTSIPLNIAEGNGKFAIKDRCRFRDFARGSALECAACLDLSVANGVTDLAAIISGKERLFEILSMLMGLISSVSSRVAEEADAHSLSAGQE